jgi:hypothetical protein
MNYLTTHLFQIAPFRSVFIARLLMCWLSSDTDSAPDKTSKSVRFNENQMIPYKKGRPGKIQNKKRSSLRALRCGFSDEPLHIHVSVVNNIPLFTIAKRDVKIRII